MKLIYFEKSFISVFGFIIPSFFSFARSKERRKLPTLKLFFYAGKPKRLVIQGFLQKEKERKLQYQWYHNFRSYLVGVRWLEHPASCSQSKRATNCATPRNKNEALACARMKQRQSRHEAQNGVLHEAFASQTLFWTTKLYLIFLPLSTAKYSDLLFSESLR